MKILSTFSFLIVCGFSYAQPKIVNQAVITTLTTVIAPEEDDVANVQNPQGGNTMMRNFGDGETKSTTFLKNNMVKTVMKSDIGRSTIIRDNDLKKTTTLIEMMGNKRGFYITDEEQAEMRKKMDSMMATRRDSAGRPRPSLGITSEYTIENSGETKKVAGYLAKKAYVVRTNILGKDSTAIWYTPDIKFPNIPTTGGLSGFGNMMSATQGTNGFDKVEGFILQYETKMPRGRRMIVEVTKIETDKEVKDKEFEIPKDFDVKPMKDFQNQMRFGNSPGQIRIGG